MYRFLLTRRWVSLMVTMLLVIPACVELGLWQLDRLHKRQDQNGQVHRNAEAEPKPLTDLTSVGGSVAQSDEWRAVSVAGHYDESHQLLVRNRPRDGEPGFYVLTPLVLGSEPAVLVNRGWVAAPRTNDEPEVPGVPSGDVRVTGRLRPTETQNTKGPKDADDVPAGQVVRIDVPRIAPSLPYPVLAGYVDLATQDPAPPVINGSFVPNPLDVPSRSEAMHLSYAAQWFIFALVAPIGFFFLARREAADRRKAARMPAPRRAPVPTPPPTPGTSG